MRLNDILIDNEFASVCPALTDEERSLLTKNIERDGFRDAVVVWKEKQILMTDPGIEHLRRLDM